MKKATILLVLVFVSAIHVFGQKVNDSVKSNVPFINYKASLLNYTPPKMSAAVPYANKSSKYFVTADGSDDVRTGNDAETIVSKISSIKKQIHSRRGNYDVMPANWDKALL